MHQFRTSPMHLSISPGSTAQHLEASFPTYGRAFTIHLTDRPQAPFGWTSDSYLIRQYAEWAFARAASMNMYAQDVAGAQVSLRSIVLERSHLKATLMVEVCGVFTPSFCEQMVRNQFCDGLENILGILSVVQIVQVGSHPITH